MRETELCHIIAEETAGEPPLPTTLYEFAAAWTASRRYPLDGAPSMSAAAVAWADRLAPDFRYTPLCDRQNTSWGILHCAYVNRKRHFNSN